MSTTPAPVIRKRHWLLLLVLIWLGLMGLVWWLGHQLSPAWFDPARIAPHGFTESHNVDRFYQALTKVVPDLPADSAFFIRFAQPDCPCERYVENYHQLMLPTLKKQGLHPITLTPAMMQQMAQVLGPQLWEWVPSTPAILLLDQQRQVAYFGPYHQAGICNSENSYLEPVLQTLQQQQPVNIINTLVEGCFCPYPAVRSIDAEP